MKINIPIPAESLFYYQKFFKSLFYYQKILPVLENYLLSFQLVFGIFKIKKECKYKKLGHFKI